MPERKVVPTKLFVGNISHAADNQALREEFEKYGVVVECDIIKDYGFVHFEKADDAEAAQQALNGVDFMGTKLRVEKSNSFVRQKPGAGTEDETVCYYCGEKGHWARKCSKYPEEARRGTRSRDYGERSSVRGWTDFAEDDLPPPRRRLPPPDDYYRRPLPYDPYYDRVRDPYAYARDPYRRDPYDDPYDRYLAPAPRDPLRRPPPEYYASRYDPYARAAARPRPY